MPAKQAEGNIKCKINENHSEVKEFAHEYSYFSSLPALGTFCARVVCVLVQKHSILIMQDPSICLWRSVCVVERGTI